MTSIPSGVLSVPVLLYLANVAIASVLVCGGGLIFERLCRHRSLPFRHALLVTALAAALATPIVVGAALASGRSLFRISLTGPQQPPVSTPAAVPNPTGELPAASDLPPAASLAETADAAAATSSDRGALASPSAPPHRSQSDPFLWINLSSLLGIGLAIVWFAGCAVTSWRLMRGLAQVRRLSQGLRPIADARLEDLAATTARQLGLRKAVALYESPQVPAPLSVGLVHPIIVLPVGLAASLEPEQLRGLLLHEMAQHRAPRPSCRPRTTGGHDRVLVERVGPSCRRASRRFASRFATTFPPARAMPMATQPCWSIWPIAWPPGRLYRPRSASSKAPPASSASGSIVCSTRSGRSASGSMAAARPWRPAVFCCCCCPPRRRCQPAQPRPSHRRLAPPRPVRPPPLRKSNRRRKLKTKAIKAVPPRHRRSPGPRYCGA